MTILDRDLAYNELNLAKTVARGARITLSTTPLGAARLVSIANLRRANAILARAVKEFAPFARVERAARLSAKVVALRFHSQLARTSRTRARSNTWGTGKRVLATVDAGTLATERKAKALAASQHAAAKRANNLARSLPS